MSEKKAVVKSFFVVLSWTLVTIGLIVLVQWGFSVNELITASIILFMMIFWTNMVFNICILRN